MISRRALIGGSAIALAASAAEARLPWLNKSGVAAAIQAINPAPTLAPGGTYSSMYAGRGTLPVLDMSMRGDGTYGAQITAKAGFWDHIAIPAGSSFELTNVCGNADVQNPSAQCITRWYLGAAGNFNSVDSGLQLKAQQYPFQAFLGNRVIIQAPSNAADSWADLIIFTIPFRGVPDVQIYRLHFLGTNDAAAPKVYVTHAITPMHGLGVGSDTSTNPTNKATPFASIHRAVAYAAANKIRQIFVDGATGTIPFTLKSATRTLSYPDVYFENLSYTTLSTPHLMPIEISELNGGPLVWTRSYPDYFDARSQCSWLWPANRVIDIGVTWLLSSNKETVIGSIGSANGSITNINVHTLGIGRTRVDITADGTTLNGDVDPNVNTGLYTEILQQFTDNFFNPGNVPDAPEISFLGELESTGEGRISNGGNFQGNTTFNQVGVDCFSTTGTGQGETLHVGVNADESRFEYDRLHISRSLPLAANPIRDSYNEYTVFQIAPEPFQGVAKVAIIGNNAFIQTFVDDGTYSNPLPHRLSAPGTVGIGAFNVYFPPNSPGPLAGKRPTSGAPGFTDNIIPSQAANSYTFRVDVTGLGLAATAGTAGADANGYVPSGTFTFTSLANYAAPGPYSCIMAFQTCAKNRSSAMVFVDNDFKTRYDFTPSYNNSGANPLPANGCLGYISTSAGPGNIPALLANNATQGTRLHTPRITISGTTLKGQGFLNGGLNSIGGVAASPAVAIQDAPKPTTTIYTTTDANGRTLVQCSGALPPSALFYWGCKVTADSGQVLKVASNINYGSGISAGSGQPSGGTAGSAVGQPGYSFYATPISSGFADIPSSSPSTWSFVDNMHGIFPNSRLTFNGDYTRSVNVLSVSGETVIVDAAPAIGDQATPITFGHHNSGNTTQIVCAERFHDPYGVAITPLSADLAEGDLVWAGIEEHPDDLQVQSTSAYFGAKPLINKLIRDRVHTRGKSIQFEIVGFVEGVMPGTVALDANGQPTFSLPSITCTAIDSATPKAYTPYGFGKGGGYPANDLYSGSPTATSFPPLLFYKVTFSGCAPGFSFFQNGWGNIRVMMPDGVRSMRLFSQQTTAAGIMTAFLQDDTGIGSLPMNVNDTVQHPLPMVDGGTLVIGTRQLSAAAGATLANQAQVGIVTLNQANPAKPTVHKGFNRFAGQSGLTYYVASNIHRGLYRSYQFTEYGAYLQHGAYDLVGQNNLSQCLSDFTYINCTILSYPSGSTPMICHWQTLARVSYIDTIVSGPLSIYGVSNGSVAFDDAYLINSIANQWPAGANLPGGVTASNLQGNVLGQQVEVDPLTGKPVAVYQAAPPYAQQPIGNIPVIPARGPLYPLSQDNVALKPGMYIGASQPLVS